MKALYIRKLAFSTFRQGGNIAMPKKQSKEPKIASKPTETGPVILDSNGSILIKINAKPGAKQNNITDIDSDVISVQIAAPPVEGAANTELIKYLASVLDVRKSDLTLEKGSRSRDKCVSVARSLKFKAEDVLEKLKNAKFDTT